MRNTFPSPDAPAWETTMHRQSQRSEPVYDTIGTTGTSAQPPVSTDAPFTKEQQQWIIAIVTAAFIELEKKQAARLSVGL